MRTRMAGIGFFCKADPDQGVWVISVAQRVAQVPVPVPVGFLPLVVLLLSREPRYCRRRHEHDDGHGDVRAYDVQPHDHVLHAVLREPPLVD